MRRSCDKFWGKKKTPIDHDINKIIKAEFCRNSWTKINPFYFYVFSIMFKNTCIIFKYRFKNLPTFLEPYCWPQTSIWCNHWSPSIQSIYPKYQIQTDNASQSLESYTSFWFLPSADLFIFTTSGLFCFCHSSNRLISYLFNKYYQSLLNAIKGYLG